MYAHSMTCTLGPDARFRLRVRRCSRSRPTLPAAAGKPCRASIARAQITMICTSELTSATTLLTVQIGRISRVGTIPPVTIRDRHSRHREVGDAATVRVAVTAGQDAVRAAKVTAVLIKRCRTVLTERCRYITK